MDVPLSRHRMETLCPLANTKRRPEKVANILKVPMKAACGGDLFEKRSPPAFGFSYALPRRHIFSKFCSLEQSVHLNHQGLDRIHRFVEGLLLFREELQLNDSFHAPGAEDRRNAHKDPFFTEFSVQVGRNR